MEGENQGPQDESNRCCIRRRPGASGAEIPGGRSHGQARSGPQSSRRSNLKDPAQLHGRRQTLDADRRQLAEGVHSQLGQLAMDSEHQAFAVEGVSNQLPDIEHIGTLLERNAAQLVNYGTYENSMRSNGVRAKHSPASRAGSVLTSRKADCQITSLGSPTETRWRRQNANSPQAKKQKDLQTVCGRRQSLIRSMLRSIKRGLSSKKLRNVAKLHPEWHLITSRHNLFKLLRL